MNNENKIDNKVSKVNKQNGVIGSSQKGFIGSSSFFDEREASSARRCIECGAILPVGATSCPFCSEKPSDNTAGSTDDVFDGARKGRQSDMKLFVVAVAVIVVVAVIVICCITRNSILSHLGTENGVSEDIVTEDETTDAENTTSEPHAQTTVPDTVAETTVHQEYSTRASEVYSASGNVSSGSQSVPSSGYMQPEVNISMSDVEAIVLRNRDMYNDTYAKVHSNVYKETVLTDGIKAYTYMGELKEITVDKGYGGSDYMRWFFYDKGKLFFAYYEDYDADRFYFYDNSLVRWRYCPDADYNDIAINHDLENTPEFYEWESTVLSDSKLFLSLFGALG